MPFPLRVARQRSVRISMRESLVQGAQLTAEEWLSIADQKLKKATLAMFPVCKEVADKVHGP